MSGGRKEESGRGGSLHVYYRTPFLAFVTGVASSRPRKRKGGLLGWKICGTVKIHFTVYI